MRKMIIVISLIFPLILAAQDAYIELLKSDIRAQKVAIITETMDFSEKQASLFWPVYREFNAAQEKIADEQLNLIKQYLKFYENMTDETAKVLWKKSLEIDQSRLDLRKKYFTKFEKILSAKLTAKLLQLEQQINMLIRIQVESQLPLLK